MAFQLILGWTQFVSSYKPTSIWLLTSNWSEHHEKLLKFCGEYYSIPVYLCKNGIQDQFFVNSWLRLLKKNNIDTDDFINNEIKANKRKKDLNDDDSDGIHDNDDDDDDDGENDDDDDDDNGDDILSVTNRENNTRKNKNETRSLDSMDECNQFVSNFLTPSRKPKKSWKTKSGKLSKYPKIRPAKKFLSFQDKDTKFKRFIPQTRKIQSNLDRQKFHEFVGGRVMTRSSTRNSQSKNNADVNDDIIDNSVHSSSSKNPARQKTSDHHLKTIRQSSPLPSHETSKVKKKDYLDEEKERQKDNKDHTFQTEFERLKKEDENQNSADIPEHSIFIFDDLLSGTSNLSADPKDTTKNMNQEYLRRLSFVKELFAEKSHSLRYNFA